LIYLFFNDTATTEIYTLSLHDALPILSCCRDCLASRDCKGLMQSMKYKTMYCLPISESDFSFTWMDIDIDQVRIQFEEQGKCRRSEEHTSELQSRENLVCRLLLEKKNK